MTPRRRATRVPLAACTLAVTALPARAQDGTLPASQRRPPAEAPAPERRPEPSRLLDLFPPLRREREALEGRGWRFGLTYTGEGFANVRGGLRTDEAHDYEGLLDLTLAFDAEAAGLWPGGEAFLHAQQKHGHGPSQRFVGDAQAVSNLDTDQDDWAQLSQIYVRQGFLDDRLWLKVGKQEANADFAFAQHGLGFMHSSAGYPPNIPLASYPHQDWGAAAALDWPDLLRVAAGVFQGRPDGGRSPRHSFRRLFDPDEGPMVLAQVDLRHEALDLGGALRLGTWWNGARAARLERDDPTPGRVRERWGFYAIVDQWLWREASAEEQGLGLFLQYSWAPPDRSEIEHYAGAGLQWTGALPGRDRDVLGLGAFVARFSRQADTARREEVAVEAFYTLRPWPWLALTADAQVVTHPGGADRREALVLLLRGVVAF